MSTTGQARQGVAGGGAGERGFIERSYDRLGPRYPRFVAYAVPQLALTNVLAGIAGIALFVEMSTVEFLRILTIGGLGMILFNLLHARVASGLLEPVRRWLEGDRGEEATRAAWRATANLPREMMRRDWLSGLLGGGSYLGLLVWAAYTTWELDLPAYTILPLVAGIGVFILYVQALRFFAYERALRPVLQEIAVRAGDDSDLYVPGIALRTRLLVALPAINVITGVVAVGITGQGHDLELADLGLAAVVSAGIAVSVSLALTLLLANSITAPIGALQAATERVGDGDFGARVPLVTTDETGALACSFNEMAAGLQQRERLRDAFGTFVDPDLTERVMAEGTDFAGEEVDVSLLFMDVRGFTTYAERADAREVVARLNDLYGAVVPVILRHGGHANKFIGDGLLAVFGAPNRLGDHAERAVAAAREIAAVVQNRYRGELSVGVGVNSGRVVVGTIGGGGRLDFTVIGDAVNTAARVESATRQTGDTVLITAQTLEQLAGRDGWQERPAVELKGKRRPTPLFAPGGSKAGSYGQ